MKQLFIAVISLFVLAACGEKAVVTPEVNLPGNLYYKDAHVAIADVKGVSVNNGIRFQFNSYYEKNVVKMELMSGPYENMLCFIHEEPISGTSLQKKSYTVTEQVSNQQSRFYVIKYTLRNGGWVLTPAFRFQQ